MREHGDYEPRHESSPTDYVFNELQLHGYRPLADEPDQRRFPDGNAVTSAVADIFDGLIVTLGHTRLHLQRRSCRPAVNSTAPLHVRKMIDTPIVAIARTPP